MSCGHAWTPARAPRVNAVRQGLFEVADASIAGVDAQPLQLQRLPQEQTRVLAVVIKFGAPDR
jgi:hypothetical protein